MKKNRKNVPLGRRSTEVAGSLTPDLEDLHASRQHADRSYAGHSGEADGCMKTEATLSPTWAARVASTDAEAKRNTPGSGRYLPGPGAYSDAVLLIRLELSECWRRPSSLRRILPRFLHRERG